MYAKYNNNKNKLHNKTKNKSPIAIFLDWLD
jgi:hypothetical protein